MTLPGEPAQNPAKNAILAMEAARKNLSRVSELSDYHESELARARLKEALRGLWKTFFRVQRCLVEALQLDDTLKWEEDE